MEMIENKPHRESLALALVTSFGVAVVGAGLWGLLYSLGWIASFIAYFSAFGMIYFYKKFYKLNWFAYVWIGVISIGLNTLACYLSLIINTMIKVDCSFATASQAFRLAWDEIAVDIVTDWIISAVFTILGVFSYVKYEQKNRVAKNGKNIRQTEFTEIHENENTLSEDSITNSPTNDSHKNPTKTCPFCGSTTSADKDKCDSCGANLTVE